MDAKAQISALGGARTASRLLGVPYTTVRYWDEINRIPKWRQVAVDAALAASDDLEDLTPPFPKG